MCWQIVGDENGAVGREMLALLGDCPLVVFASPMKPWPGRWRQFLVWEKGEHVSGGGDPRLCWKPSWELIQVRHTGPLNGRRDGAVLRYLADKQDYALHPSPKPLALLRYLVSKVTQPGETILDPFAGSGTTGRAAKDLGRKAVLIEREERYCEIAAKRMAQEVLDFG